MMVRIKFCIALFFIILGTFACAQPLSGSYGQSLNSQSPGPIQQQVSPLQQSPSLPSVSVPSIPQSEQQSIQTPTPQSEQPETNSGDNSLNVPMYLFSESQNDSNPKNDSTTVNNINIDNQAQIESREAQVLSLINQSREANGLAQLERNVFLDDLALEHCQDMIKSNVLSHDGFNTRAAKIMNNLEAHSIGENVAEGYDTAATLVEGWLRSPGHKENIMNPLFHRTGIGIVGNFATQIFSN